MEAMTGSAVRSKVLRDFDIDGISRKLKGRPKSVRSAKRADKRDWQRELYFGEGN